MCKNTLISNAQWKSRYWRRINKDRQEEILGDIKVSEDYLSRLESTIEYIKRTSPEYKRRIAQEKERVEKEKEKKRLEKKKKKEKKRDEAIESALGSSDFKSLFRFSSDSFDYPNGKSRAIEGLVELLKRLRIDKPDEFKDIAKYIGSKADQIRGDSKYSQLLSEFFRTLFATYPESFSVATPGFNSWIENSDSSNTIRSEVMKLSSEEFRRLLEFIPPIQKWEKLTWIEFANILILHESFNEKNQDVFNKLSFEELKHDSFFSYVVRKNNQSEKKERSHSAGLVSQIRDQNRRVMCLLSMSPEDFSEFATHYDFSTIINSPLFSLIISEEQIRHVLEEDSGEEYRVEIEEVIDKFSESLGKFTPSISTKFKNALGETTKNPGVYYTLEKFKIRNWDYYDERVLQMVEGDILAKPISSYSSKPLNEMETDVYNAYKSISKLGNPIVDPFRIARCITDFDYSFSDKVRNHLESLLMT